MQIDMKQVIKGYGGEPLIGDGGQPAELRPILINAINTVLQGQELGAEEKSRIYGLSIKLYKGANVTLTADERIYLRGKVMASYGPVVMGRVCEILNLPVETLSEP
jgi:hypothetical protein